MTQTPRPLHLFQAFGVELEYMIVDAETLHVKPIADEVLKKVLGNYGNEFANGAISWSNELVSHVIELKCTTPAADLVQLAKDFAANVQQVNQLLQSFNARLLPTAAHPWMQPAEETVLWPHDNKDIYNTYNRIFNCQGHGWSNLQSTHINLPFCGDEEFARLHTAIRLVLPLLPALAASSPILEGQFSGHLDKRLDYYQNNQKKIPSINGKVIPEQVSSERDYQRMIYDVIAADIAPYDTEQILEPVWVNSRGAIARFDRGAIEIRVLDIQECPQADLSVVALVSLLLRALVDEKFVSFAQQAHWEMEPLRQVFRGAAQQAEETIIRDADYLAVFGIEEGSLTARQVWQHIVQQLSSWYPALAPWRQTLDTMLQEGTLARRILKATGDDFSKAHLKEIYASLSRCLERNELFLP